VRETTPPDNPEEIDLGRFCPQSRAMGRKRPWEDSMRRWAAGFAALSGLALMGAGEAPTAGKVGAMPPDAEIVFASSMAGEKDAWGFPAREVYVSKADGSKLTRITWDRQSANHFAISPDRRWLFSNRYSRGDTSGDGKIDYRDFKELWLVDLKTRTEKKVLEGVDGGWGGVGWSPDSKFVYFATRENGSGVVNRWPIAGGPMERVTRNVNKLLGVPGDTYAVSDLDVSPDGKWLALLYSNGTREDAARKTRIIVYKIDGTEARFVTDGGPMKAGQYGMWPAGDFDPDFSPDGKAVSFMRATDRAMLKRNVSSSDVMTQNLDGTGLKLVSVPDNKNQNGISSWGGPWCKVIYAVWSDAEPTYIEYANRDGSDRKQLRFKAEASHVQWIPVKDEAARCK
jgi:Tol biopolymer transport system component